MSKYDPLWEYVRSCPQNQLTLTFDEVGKIAGVPIDHAFLRFKKELEAFGWQVGKISMKAQTVAFHKQEEKDGWT